MYRGTLYYGVLGGFFGILFGALFITWFNIYFDFFPNFADPLVLSLYIIMVSLIIGCTLGIVIKLLLEIYFGTIAKKESRLQLNKLWFTIFLTLPLFLVSMIIYIEVERPFEYRVLRTTIAISVVLFLSVVISKMFYQFGIKRISFSVRSIKKFSIIIIITLFFINVGGSILYKQTNKIGYFQQSSSKVSPQHRVAIIGVDGATWRIIRKLIEEKKLPNIGELVTNGVSANLIADISILNPLANTSSRGIRSPSAWTTISTGRTYREHNIHDFLKTKIPGVREYLPFRIPITTDIGIVKGKVSLKTRALSSLDRRKHALWDIANIVGLRAGIIGWWLTWPPSKVNGYMISDRFLDVDLMNKWYPEFIYNYDSSLYENEHNEVISYIFKENMLSRQAESKLGFGSHGQKNNERFDVFSRDLERDIFVYKTAVDLLVKEAKPELLMLTFLSSDSAGHLFWKYMDPDSFGEKISKDEEEEFGKVICRVYETIDKWIGQIIGILGKDYVIIICSDHGMGPWNTKGDFIGGAVFWPLFSGNHRKEGVLIMAGTPINIGAKIREAKQIDLLPTVLALLGIPIPKDIKGKVLKEAFKDPELIRDLKKVHSYEIYSRAGYLFEKGNSEIGKEYLERLEALGYVGKKKK